MWTFRTNAGAPRYRIQRVDVAAARPEWSDLVAEHPEHLLQWAAQVGPDKLVTAYLCNVQVTFLVKGCVCVWGGMERQWGGLGEAMSDRFVWGCGPRASSAAVTQADLCDF